MIPSSYFHTFLDFRFISDYENVTTYIQFQDGTETFARGADKKRCEDDKQRYNHILCNGK